MEKSSTDLFLNSLTIAMASNKIYLTNYLPEDSIGIISPLGYDHEKQQSVTLIKWLKK